MIDNLKQWLSVFFDIKLEEVESYFSNENVTGFLIIWTIYEQKLFNGFYRVNTLERFCNEYSWEWEPELEDAFKHFYYRYQDSNKFNNLCHTDTALDIGEILQLKVDEIELKSKLKLILFVVNRFRNNIFHGNKGVNSWIQYTEQIRHCVQVMKVLISQYQSHKNADSNTNEELFGIGAEG